MHNETSLTFEWLIWEMGIYTVKIGIYTVD